MSLSGDPLPGAIALRIVAVANRPTPRKIPYAGKEPGERPEWGASSLNGIGAAATAMTRAENRDRAIESYWRGGLDTLEIAEKLSWPESLIANRLAAIRDGAR